MNSLLKPRTLIAFLLYITFCYLAIKGKIETQAIVSVVSVLMGFYFGEKNAIRTLNGGNNVEKSPDKNSA